METVYVYDGAQMIAEYVLVSSELSLRKRFVYGPGIDEPIAMILVDAGQEFWYFYHTDGLGSVVALSQWNTSQVQIVERYVYDAFGKCQILTSDFYPVLRKNPSDG